MSESGIESRVLLVESHAPLRSDLSRALEARGYVVDAFGDVEAARSRGLSGRYALRILDHQAHARIGEDGEPSGTIVLACPADAEVEPALARTSSSAVEWLFKPFSIHALEARMLERIGTPARVRQTHADPLLETRDPIFERLLERARRWARRSVPICIEGELGTGRRSLARAIHDWSPRASSACVMLEGSVLEAAPSSAIAELLRERFASATAGSLILIEPESWPSLAQEALIRVLRVQSGSESARCLVVTRQSLEQSVAEARIPLELQYHLDALRLALPPLRERAIDRLRICEALARRIARELGVESPGIDEDLVEILSRDGFPGNRLGLESRLRSALVRAGDDEDLREALATDAARPSGAARDGSAAFNLKALERDTIIRALAHCDGNRTRASETLGISVRTLRNKIREYGLR